MPTFRYVTYPDAKLLDDNDKEINHLLWGDWVRVEGPAQNGWVPVHARGCDGWLEESQLQEDRVLEITFVDVGQGDGALIVTPDDRHVLVDAGEQDNMYRFLKWRYAGFKKKWTFEAAILTHPDQDHYRGFTDLFEHENVKFRAVYHNGIMEEATKGKPLGPMTKRRKPNYLTGLIENQADLEAFIAAAARWTTARGGKKQYPLLMSKALSSLAVGGNNRVRMLSTDPTHNDGDGFIPGFGKNKALRLRVLGPIVERDDAGKARLRVFGKKIGHFSLDTGKTKNGHSVIFIVEFGAVRIMMGGDLNTPAEAFLLEHYTGIGAPAEDANAEERLVEAARPIFGADIAKSCHHGSADFSDSFLRAIHPAATVVSSGDEESHAHPRSDTLGAIGLHGRGWRPLILSTELVRSHREDEGDLREKIGRILAKIDAEDDADKKKTLIKERDKLLDEIAKRNVTVYGAINLRTDGDKALFAYKLEKPRVRKNTMDKWDMYRLERSGAGPLTYRAE